MKTIFFLLLLSVAVCAQSGGVPAAVAVVGEADMRIAPDEVYFTLEVITSGNEVAAATRASDLAVGRLVAATRAFKISEEDVRTESFTVSPKYSSVKRPGTTREERVLAGYEVTNRTHVTLKDLKRIDEFLSRAIEAGVNRVVSIDIGHSEYDKFQAQTRAMAVKNAEEKARAYAQQLGLTLGKAYIIREEEADRPGYEVGYGSGNGNGSGQGDTEYGAPAPTAFDRAITFSLGRIELAEKIYVTFELRR